jgi:predicted permease
MIPFLLLQKIFQLFIAMVLGFLLTKLGLLKQEDSLSLSRLSLYLLLPAAIIHSFNVEMTREILGGFLISCAAGIVLHLLFLGIDFAFAKIAHASAAERASVFYSNAANLIIPIVSFILGSEWVIYSLGFMMVQLVFIWSHGVRLFERGKKINFRKILLNPTILAIAVGMTLMLAGIRLPSLVSDVAASLGGVLGYVGMLIAGITATKIDLKRTVKNKRLYLTSLMRVVFCPLATLVLIRVALLFITVQNAEKIFLISFLATATPAAAVNKRLVAEGSI